MHYPRNHDLLIDYYGMALDRASQETRTATVSSSVDNFEMEIAHALIVPGDRAIIAGCGMGSIAAWVSSLLGTENVLSYEANAALVAQVRDNVRVGGKPLQVESSALDAVSGKRYFNMPSGRWTRSSLEATPAMDEAHWGKSRLVPTVAVNEALDAFGANVLLLDVEGTEQAILPTLEWDRLRLLIIELHDWDGSGVATQRQMIYDHMDVVVDMNATPIPWLHVLGAVKKGYLAVQGLELQLSFLKSYTPAS